MLSCAVCCSFRAVRLLCLILLQQSSLKKPFFFFSNAVLRGLGFIFGCPLRSCPARRQTSHCLPAEASPCCCVVHLVASGSAVLLCSPPCPVAESLCCSWLPWQWQAVSAVGVYLSSDGLPRQWLAASAVGVYFSRDRLPRHRLAVSAMGVYLSWGGLPR